MKYLQYLKESSKSTFEDDLKKLQDITFVEETLSDLDGLIQDVEDDLDLKIAKPGVDILVKYKRKKRLSSKISYNYLLSGTVSAIIRNDLRLFLEKSELAYEFSISYKYLIYFNINSFDNTKVLKSLRLLEKKCESIGLSFNITSRYDGGSNFLSIEDALSSGSTSFLLIITKEIDPDLLKSDIDIESQIPPNIIVDFNEFTNKYRIPTVDKQNLINIIKKGDWTANKVSESKEEVQDLSDYSVGGRCRARCDRKVLHTKKGPIVVCDGCKRIVRNIKE